MTYMVFNLRSDGVVDAIFGLTDVAPTGGDNIEFRLEGKQLPAEYFDGRGVVGVSMYVYNPTERQMKPSLYYVELVRKGIEQLEVRNTNQGQVLDTSLAIR